VGRRAGVLAARRRTADCVASALLGLLLLAPVLRAEVTATDIQVAARALSFVADPPTGVVRVGIVYARGNRKSSQQAQELRSLLGDGFRVGPLELKPVLVEASAVEAANVNLYFLTSHLTPAETPHFAVRGSGMRTLCITTDITQVRNGSCLLGIRSKPKVEVLVNRATALKHGVTFSTVFRVMITEV
jgi:hypothetical protein